MDRVDGTVRDVFEGCLGYAQKASQKRNITATLAGFADTSGFTEGGAPCVCRRPFKLPRQTLSAAVSISLWNPEVGLSFHLSWLRSGFKLEKARWMCGCFR